MKAYLNGKLITDARIPADDYGLTYGYGLYETMRAYHGRIFKEEEHISRLLRGAETLGISVGLNKEQLSAALDSTLTENRLKDASLKIIVTYGKGPGGMRFTGKEKPNMIIIASKIPDYSKRYENGIRVTVAENRRNNHSPISRIKTLNCLDSALARKNAQERGYDDALLLNCDGNVAEGTTSNVFIVSGEQLITPPESAGILNGITRETVMGIAGGLGLTASEEDFKLERLLKSDECFQTSSVAEISPIVEVDGEKIGKGKLGKMTEAVHRQYRKLTEGI
ncbi:MAG: aminotransferase class IV [Candidatus Altiarchaeota archaeon]